MTQAEGMSGLLYKYGSVGEPESEGRPRALGAIEFLLEGRTLRFARASAQNDINEAYPNFGDIVQEEMYNVALRMKRALAHQAPKACSQPDDLFVAAFYMDPKLGVPAKTIALRTAWKGAHKKFEAFGILSLTKRSDNLLMWAHYAGGPMGAASGLCVGFDPSARIFTDSIFSEAGLAGPSEVIYSEDRASLKGGTLASRLAQAVMQKSIDWAYEDEVRCVRKLALEQAAEYPSFEAADVREIILGPNMTAESAIRCRDLWNAHFQHASLLLALPDPEKYRMQLYRCPLRDEEIHIVFSDPSREMRRLPLG